MNKLITAGELAKLAGTTKRTIHFYDEKGVLRPIKVAENKYRLYEECQILDYQMLLLLTTLGIPLGEIKTYLNKKGSLKQLFSDKKILIKKQIEKLHFDLKSLNGFMANLAINGTMINPKIITMNPFGIYYIEKTGAYSKIGQYCSEFVNMFEYKAGSLTTLAIFEDPDYQPKKSRIKIGVLASKNLKIRKQFENVVRYLDFSPGKVITYTHNGSGSLLSLFWKELEKYCKLNNLTVRKDIPDFEIYRKVNDDITKQFFEIYLPIK